MEKVRINDRLYIKNKYNGTIKFIGNIAGKEGKWVGIELDQPMGKNDGGYGGQSYFECQPKHGLFIKYERILSTLQKTKEKLPDINESSFLSTEEIINKYANYTYYSAQNPCTNEEVTSMDHENKENCQGHHEIYSDIQEAKSLSTSVEKDKSKLQELKEEIKKYKRQLRHLESCTFKTEKERDLIVNLLNDIFKYYSDRDNTNFDKSFIKFKRMLKKYGIEIN
ncbi:hypothetical protein NUSPORA_01939 [Nucleospora cyclopteri]